MRLIANNIHILSSPPPLAQRIRDIRRANIATQASRASCNAKDQSSAAREEVEETNQCSSGCSDKKSKHDDHKAGSSAEKDQQSGSSTTTEMLFDRVKASVSSASPKVSVAFRRLKEVNVSDVAKKGYDIIKDEISGKPSKKRHLEYTPRRWVKGFQELTLLLWKQRSLSGVRGWTVSKKRFEVIPYSSV